MYSSFHFIPFQIIILAFEVIGAALRSDCRLGCYLACFARILWGFFADFDGEPSCLGRIEWKISKIIVTVVHCFGLPDFGRNLPSFDAAEFHNLLAYRKIISPYDSANHSKTVAFLHSSCHLFSQSRLDLSSGPCPWIPGIWNHSFGQWFVDPGVWFLVLDLDVVHPRDSHWHIYTNLADCFSCSACFRTSPKCFARACFLRGSLDSFVRYFLLSICWPVLHVRIMFEVPNAATIYFLFSFLDFGAEDFEKYLRQLSFLAPFCSLKWCVCQFRKLLEFLWAAFAFSFQFISNSEN